MSKNMKNCGFFLVGVAVAVMAMLAMDAKTEEDLAQAEYCLMVEMWNETRGDAGWPDYKHTFKRECAKGQRHGER